MSKHFFANYFRYSKNHISSFIFIFPLLLLYELMSFLIFNSQTYIIRNSADSVLRDLFSYFFVFNSIHYYTLLFLIFSIYILKVVKDDFSNYTINVKYLFLMYLEGCVLGIFLLLLLNNNFLSYTVDFYDNLFLTFYLCLGAGIWEEILFRFILINLLFVMFKYINLRKNFSFFISIIISGIIFSAFHYIGSGADLYTHHSFIVRFLGGVILSFIYIYRGLGVSSMTHFCYDLFLVSFPIIKII